MLKIVSPARLACSFVGDKNMNSKRLPCNLSQGRRDLRPNAPGLQMIIHGFVLEKLQNRFQEHHLQASHRLALPTLPAGDSSQLTYANLQRAAFEPRIANNAYSA